MNYLTLVNNVLRRLREDEVTTVNQTSYSTLIGDLVNDAKTSVEQAWDWSALRASKTIVTSLGTQEYSLTGSGVDFGCTLFLDEDKNVLRNVTKSWMDIRTVTSGKPEYYAYSGVDSNGDTKISFYPVPNDTYTLTFNGVFRQGVLEENTDVILVPWTPVVHLSVALASRERGETGGTSTPEYFAIADKYLSDAIAYDGYRYPEELTFRVV